MNEETRKRLREIVAVIEALANEIDDIADGERECKEVNAFDRWWAEHDELDSWSCGDKSLCRKAWNAAKEESK